MTNRIKADAALDGAGRGIGREIALLASLDRSAPSTEPKAGLQRPLPSTWFLP
jgi:hypothetical protein